MVQRTRLKLENLKTLKVQCCLRRWKFENRNPIKDMYIWMYIFGQTSHMDMYRYAYLGSHENLPMDMDNE
jgi:hypothetical protein